MDRKPGDGNKERRIDVRSLPESVAELWETMLRLDPKWDLAEWMHERAMEELGLVEKHLGRERLRLEQRLHRIEGLARRLNRNREVAKGVSPHDPHQRNLFDIYESSDRESSKEKGSAQGSPLVDFGVLGSDDDPLLAIVSEHVLNSMDFLGKEFVKFEKITSQLEPLGIRADEVDEALSWLLQRRLIVETNQDEFSIIE